jgi:hypothetical protein
VSSPACGEPKRAAFRTDAHGSCVDMPSATSQSGSPRSPLTPDARASQPGRSRAQRAADSSAGASARSRSCPRSVSADPLGCSAMTIPAASRSFSRTVSTLDETRRSGPASRETSLPSDRATPTTPAAPSGDPAGPAAPSLVGQCAIRVPAGQAAANPGTVCFDIRSETTGSGHRSKRGAGCDNPQAGSAQFRLQEGGPGLDTAVASS